MKYNKYETVIVIRTDITEDTIDGFHTKVFDTCKKLGGFEVKFEVWGKRKLAYEIKKSMKGIYIYYLHIAPPAAIEELERSLRLNDAVLRFLTVQLSENVSPDDYELTSEEEISKKRITVKTIDDDAKANDAKANDAKADGAKADDAKADDAKADDAKADDAEADDAPAGDAKADDAPADAVEADDTKVDDAPADDAVADDAKVEADKADATDAPAPEAADDSNKTDA